MKRIYRSQSEGRLAGICGGLGEYFDVDPVIVRLVWIGASLATGIVPGLAMYLIAWLVIPMEPRVVARPQTTASAEPSGT